MCVGKEPDGEEKKWIEREERGECGEQEVMPPGNGVYSSLYCAEHAILDTSVLSP